MRDLTEGNLADDSNPVFSPDGKSLAYGAEAKADGWPDRTRLAVLDVASGKSRVLTEPFDVSANGWGWSPDGRTIVFHAESRARTNLYAIPANGGTPKEIRHGGSTAGAEVSRDGQVVFQVSSLTAPPELAVVRLDGTGSRALTHVNDDLVARIAWGDVKEFTFPGADGDEVQMFVVYPPGFDA